MNSTNDTPAEITGNIPKRRRGRPVGQGQSSGSRHIRGKGRGPKNKGRRGKRPLAHGDLRLLILKIIETVPSHGYGLITEIKNKTSGTYEPSPGVIYPAVETLQDLGWVEVHPEKGKRVLHITEAGRSELSEQKEALALIDLRLKNLTSGGDGLETDDIRGALRQLKHTTVSAFKGKQVDINIRKEAVVILEEARKKIEQLT